MVKMTFSKIEQSVAQIVNWTLCAKDLLYELFAVNGVVDLLRTGEITDYIYKNGEIVHA